MLQDVIHPPQEQLSIDDVSSPLGAQILELCDPDFLETLQNSEVTSTSNCCYEENSSYTANLSLPPDMEKSNNCQNNGCNITSTTTPTTTSTNTTTTSTTTTAAGDANNISSNNNNNLSIIFDPQDELDNEISASIDFSSSPSFSVPQFITTTQLQDQQFDFSSVQPQFSASLLDMITADGLTQYPSNSVAPLMVAPPLRSVFEEDCLSSVPSYAVLNPSSPSCSFLGPAMSTYMSTGTMTSALSADGSGIFGGNVLLGSELQPQDLEYQGDNGGSFFPDSIPRVFNPGDLQALGDETQRLVSGDGNSTPLTADISSLEDSAFKVGKLSVEQRKEKIHRYMKKRNERNFSKKIKYACRKTLADSRPRVRGRFAKNDDFGETNRAACSNHEDEDDEEMIVKEEEDMVDQADIFTHISGVNSFKCNYPIQSWI